MKAKISFMFFLMGISATIWAQKSVDSANSKNEKYCTIDISRVMAWQEYNQGTSLTSIMVYINEQPACELTCPSRASIKMFSEGKISLTVKWIPNKKYNEKKINKYLHSGQPLDIVVSHGETYYLHLGLVEKSKFKIDLTGSIVSSKESEVNFKNEERFKNNREIKEYTEDLRNPFIKK